jgi:glutamate/tyrosine decarboxylase-like PLP-dependent enzyme
LRKGKKEFMTPETLDPRDWNELRELGHRMLDDMFEYMQNLRDQPAWQPYPAEARAAIGGAVPQSETDAAAVYENFKQNILPYPNGNIHPRFWGWVQGTGTPLGVLSEMLAATMNPNVGGGNHSAAHVETQVIDWLKEIFDFPKDASGLLVSGGSMANFVGLAVARNARANFDARAQGLSGHAPLVFYGSVEMHSSILRSTELLGVGNQYLRRIAVNEAFEIDVHALRDAIVQDKQNGLQPVCVIGNAGTVNTGATDDLDALANLAREFGMWFHVDGAFGAWAYALPEFRARMKGFERADSLAFDLHKWFYVPYEAGATLVRSNDAHFQTFTVTPPYLKHTGRGPHSGQNWFTDYGLQLSRGFRALRVWMAFETFGMEKMTRLFRQNIAQAQSLAALVERAPHLELVAPHPLNVVCFRFVAPNLDDAKLNALNQELLARIQESGIAVPSQTTLHGKFALRCAITNHRSRDEDFEMLVQAAERIGAELMEQFA